METLPGEKEAIQERVARPKKGIHDRHLAAERRLRTCQRATLHLHPHNLQTLSERLEIFGEADSRQQGAAATHRGQLTARGALDTSAPSVAQLDVVLVGNLPILPESILEAPAFGVLRTLLAVLDGWPVAVETAIFALGHPAEP